MKFEIVFLWDGKEYTVHNDFEDPVDAEFALEENNYSCDCNRSYLIHREYPDVPEKDCGCDITLISYRPLPN